MDYKMKCPNYKVCSYIAELNINAHIKNLITSKTTIILGSKNKEPFHLLPIQIILPTF